MSQLRVNPLYLYSEQDTEAIFDGVVPKSDQRSNDIYLVQQTVLNDAGAVQLKKQLNEFKTLRHQQPNAGKKGKVVCLIAIRSTLTNPHFILPNGDLTHERSGKTTHLREYFDGSTLQDLGHAITACIDFDAEKIILQDSKGCLFDKRAREAISAVFPDFDVEELQVKQQKDGHNCAVISIFNAIAFAKEQSISPNIDPQAARERFAQFLPANYGPMPAESLPIYQRPFLSVQSGARASSHLIPA